MQTIYLKAPSRAALIAALEAAGMWQTDSEGSRFQGPHPGDALDEIGTIYRGTGVFIERWTYFGLFYAEDGKTPVDYQTFDHELFAEELDSFQASLESHETVEQQEPVEGYHANLLLHGEVPEAIEGIKIAAPSTPRRVFAGV